VAAVLRDEEHSSRAVPVRGDLSHLDSLLTGESGPVRPFRPNELGLDAFPMDLWTGVSARVLRNAKRSLLARGMPEAMARFANRLLSTRVRHVA
jgi:hypothetical protein